MCIDHAVVQGDAGINGDGVSDCGANGHGVGAAGACVLTMQWSRGDADSGGGVSDCGASGHGVGAAGTGAFALTSGPGVMLIVVVV